MGAATARAKLRLIGALDLGSSLRCPRCGVRAIKDNACIHIDSCACGSKWCFLCNKESGDATGQCPRGPGNGGCDEHALFLENSPGWSDCAIEIDGEMEQPGMGAQQEYLRRRMAFLARKVMEDTPVDVWEQLRKDHAHLLTDVPTPGRNIGWETLPSAELPMFGTAGLADGDTQLTQWAALVGQEAGLEARNQRRRDQAVRRGIFPALIIALVVVLLVDSNVIASYFPPGSPMSTLNASQVCNTTEDLSNYLTSVADRCCEDNLKCSGNELSSCTSGFVCSFCGDMPLALRAAEMWPGEVLVSLTQQDSDISGDELESVVAGLSMTCDEPADTADVPSSLVFSVVRGIPWMEIVVMAVHWMCALYTLCRLQGEENERLGALLRQCLVAVPVFCSLLYWPVAKSKLDFACGNWFVYVFLAPLSVALGNLVVPIYTLPLVLNDQNRNAPPAWVICSGFIHTCNVCCVGPVYFVFVLVLRIQDDEYCEDRVAVADNADVIDTEWSGTEWPCRAVFGLSFVACCGTAALAVLDTGQAMLRAPPRANRRCDRLQTAVKFLCVYIPVLIARMYIFGWPYLLLSPRELGEVTNSTLQSVALVGSTATGIAMAVRQFADLVPVRFSECMFPFSISHVVAAVAVLCPAFALLVFWRSIGAEVPASDASFMPPIYAQAVAVAHLAFLLVLAGWLRGADQERAETFLSRRVSAWSYTKVELLRLQVLACLALICWPVVIDGACTDASNAVPIATSVVSIPHFPTQLNPQGRFREIVRAYRERVCWGCRMAC